LRAELQGLLGLPVPLGLLGLLAQLGRWGQPESAEFRGFKEFRGLAESAVR
jgi:hypothetical protein